MRSTLNITVICAAVIMLVSCSAAKKIDRSAKNHFLREEGIRTAHVGISLFDADKESYLYNYQADKYYVPASNTKLFSLYAALRFLGDSLPGMRYHETSDSIYLEPAGDPTLLHPDFKQQPVIDWLKRSGKELVITDQNWKEKEFGYGWSWDDFNSAYMAERSPLPVYGNVVRWTQVMEKAETPDGKIVDEAFVFSEPEVSWKVRFNPARSNNFAVVRERNDNVFYVTEGREILRTVEVPFVTNGVLSAVDLLRDTIGRSVLYVPAGVSLPATNTRFSQRTDSMLSVMMHRSDNLFAEQVLLMVSQQLTGGMKTSLVIDTLLKTDLEGLPQVPRWVDGSGLSRYNQFTPQDFVWILQKMRKEFGTGRLNTILPGANEGTLTNYYKGLEGAIYAKTGTLSGQVALSGYLTTRKGRRLVFSVLVNNHQTSAVIVRRGVESFLRDVYENY